MSLYSRFPDRPDLALVELFKQPRAVLYGPRPRVFVWVSTLGTDGVRYGSFKYVYQDELKKRRYQVEWCDYAPGIFYLDERYNPLTCKNEPCDPDPGQEPA